MRTRRVAAGALVAVAAVLAVRDGIAPEGVEVVAAAHDLAPGRALTIEDVTTTVVVSAPPGAVTDPAAVVGRVATAPVAAGEPMSERRLVGARLASAAVDGIPDARITAVRLADADVARVLREGDRVDVLALADRPDVEDPLAPESPAAVVLAEDAAVVLSAVAEGAGRDPVVLLALPAAAANAVASASLSRALTVTMR